VAVDVTDLVKSGKPVGHKYRMVALDRKESIWIQKRAPFCGIAVDTANGKSLAKAL
jgi:hypothetical protein